MKRNVDLTSDGVFSTRPIRLNSLNRLLRSVAGGKGPLFPWTFESKGTDYSKELFYTGNKEERRLKKEYNIRDVNSCDCCGKVNIKKWDFKYCLCMDCSNELDKRDQFGKIWILKGYGSNVRGI